MKTPKHKSHRIGDRVRIRPTVHSSDQGVAWWDHDHLELVNRT